MRSKGRCKTEYQESERVKKANGISGRLKLESFSCACSRSPRPLLALRPVAPSFRAIA